MTPPAGATGPARARLDRPVLVGNLVSGAVWLLALAFPWTDALGGWGLFLIGAAYVAVGSVFLAAVYGRDRLTANQEALAWVAPWLAAAVLWGGLLGPFESTLWGWLPALGVGLVIATPCYLVWQALALAVRQLLVWWVWPTTSPS